MGRTYKSYTTELTEGLETLVLDDPVAPVMPNGGNQVDFELWKLDVKELRTKLQLSCQSVLDPKRANGQSHAHVPRLTQNHEQKQSESDHKKDRIQPQEKENPRHPSQF